MIENAKWISAGDGQPAPCILKQFNIENVRSALLSITGLGYFIVKINGKDVTQDLFNPVFSDFRERDFGVLTYPINDKMTHRVYYCQYDVGKLLVEGQNKIEVYLGNGWYNQNKRTAEGHLEFGKQLITKFSLKIVTYNGYEYEIISDGSEKWCETEVVENNIFYGEVHDFRRKHATQSYFPVVIEDEFDTTYTLQTCPAERIVKRFKPTLISEKNGKKLFDVGQTVSGWVNVKVRGKSGDIIRINHADFICDNGEMYDGDVGGLTENEYGELQKQLTTYILDGKVRRCHPKFSRQAFRYFEIEGDFISLYVDVIHTDLPQRTTFECDNDILNWLYDAYKRTQIINMHDGMPSDCPHRERLGYTGDGQITASAAMTFFESDMFYRKWIQDIIDCQNINNGHIQHTAPFYGGGGGPVGWGGAIVQVPYAHYLHYGDKAVIENAFPAMLKWVDYICSRTEKGLVCKEEEGGWCLGDWSAIDAVVIPQEFVNTALFVRNLDKISIMAYEIGESQKVSYLKALADGYRYTLVKKYYNTETCSFCDGVQAADAFALSIGLGNDKTKHNLIKRYTENCFFDMGFLGVYQLIEYLIGVDEIDLAYDLLSSSERGSFGFLKNLGEDCICELLRGINGSHCHPMFGGVAEFLMSSLLGFPVSNVSKDIELVPRFPKCVNNAKGSIKILDKQIKVSWKRKLGNGIEYTITIPADFNAKIIYNDNIVTLTTGKNIVVLK